MKNNKLLEDDSLDPFTIKLNDNYVHELISSEQYLGVIFIIYTLDQFKKSCRMLDIVKHHLFEFLLYPGNILHGSFALCVY